MAFLAVLAVANAAFADKDKCAKLAEEAAKQSDSFFICCPDKDEKDIDSLKRLGIIGSTAGSFVLNMATIKKSLKDAKEGVYAYLRLMTSDKAWIAAQKAASDLTDDDKKVLAKLSEQEKAALVAVSPYKKANAILSTLILSSTFINKTLKNIRLLFKLAVEGSCQTSSQASINAKVNEALPTLMSGVEIAQQMLELAQELRNGVPPEPAAVPKGSTAPAARASVDDDPFA